MDAIMNRTKEKLTFLAMLCSLFGAQLGCRSFSTTPLSRFEDDSFIGNSNGENRFFCNARPHKGVPVKIKVTTHQDIYIKQRYCVENVGTTINEPFLHTPLCYVESTPVETEQVVIVDFKRPGSGSLDLNATMSDQQYFESITSKLQDTTITDTANLVKSIAKLAAAPVSSGFYNPGDEDNSRKWLDRTIAYQRFDINDPMYEQKVEEFVNYHLSSCNNNGVQSACIEQ